MNRIKSLLMVCGTLLFLCPVMLSGQERSVTGRVTSSVDGRPAVYANIIVRGHSDLNQTTDENGSFKLTDLPSSVNSIWISCPGFITSEVLITGTELNVRLSPEIKDLVADKIRVTALGVLKRDRELGYSLADLSEEEIAESGALSMTALLRGRVSGLILDSNPNARGGRGSTQFNFRSIKTITGNNQAMLIVDGVETPIELIDTINPNDVENVTMLKGASAAALYGSQAANGVVLITTKR